LINLKNLFLHENQLTSLPNEIISIINVLIINETSYEINNLDAECEILIFHSLNINISNLPINLKEIWLQENIKIYDLKLPLNCKIKIIKNV